MSISGINSFSTLQWLQSSLSAAGLTVGNQSSAASCGPQSGSDAISLFQQALQVIPNQTATPTDSQQSLSVNGTQGQHHHHHHHSGGERNDQGNGAFIDQLAQLIVSDLQQTDGTGTAPTAGSSSASSASNGSGGSFIDGLASAIANNLAHYQQAMNSSPAPSSSPSPQVNAIA